MGTPKICILTSDMREVATTSSCVRIYSSLADEAGHDIWYPLKLSWMDKTYVPIILVKESTGPRKKWEAAYVMSRDLSAILVCALGSKDKMWLNRDKCHPDDWDVLVESADACHSVRVPEWVAKKGGLYGSGKL